MINPRDLNSSTSLKALHDIMKINALLPTVQRADAPYRGRAEPSVSPGRRTRSTGDGMGEMGKEGFSGWLKEFGWGADTIKLYDFRLKAVL